jgi:hypothetical protein
VLQVIFQSVFFFQVVEQEHVAHTGVGARIGEHVSRRGDKEDVGALFHVRGLNLDAGDLFDVLDEEVEHVLEGMRLDAQVVAGAVAVGHRRGDPVDVQAQQIQHSRPMMVISAVSMP